MNHKNHITHHKGRPLKDLTQAELIAVVTEQQVEFQELLKEYHLLQMKSGRSIIESHSSR